MKVMTLSKLAGCNLWSENPGSSRGEKSVRKLRQQQGSWFVNLPENPGRRGGTFVRKTQAAAGVGNLSEKNPGSSKSGKYVKNPGSRGGKYVRKPRPGVGNM